MKLDPTILRTMNSQDFRVLEAVEKGMKNHAIVPLPLITSIANLRHGGTHKVISSLLRDKLLSHETTKSSYDGYRLTNAGYDIMALQNLKARGFIAALGQRVGTGKESDVYLAATPEGKQIVLKIHRLGRTSFRNVKQKRDYFGKAVVQSHSWLFLSRLSALKEYAFMKALFDVKYPTPTPIAHNRHIVAMSLVRGLPLYQIFPKQISVEQAADIYNQAVGLAARLVQHGLVHCDLNEFNLLVDLSGIQSLATDAEDPYVRHSGQSVVAGTVKDDKSVGFLSKPAWEQSLEQGDNIAEALPEPVARLDNGEPKPIVTLIDFPQMISTKHPNAKELYERDLACVRRFFEMKLQCTIPEDDVDKVAWEYVISRNEEDVIDAAEKRLDTELRASGFSDDMGRGLELYYFENGPSGAAATAVEEISEGEESDNSQSADDGVEEDLADTPVANHDDEELPNVNVCSADEGKDDNAGEVCSVDQWNNKNAGEVCSVDEWKNDNAGEVVDILDYEELNSIARDKVVERAKERVRRQLEEERKKSRKKGAFRSGNRNKAYIKGKRVMAESGAW
jgi:RIO kinase 2